MIIHTKVCLSLLLAGCLTSSLVAYQAHAESTRPPGEGRLAERLTELGITPAQKAAAKDILRKHQPSVEPLLRELVAARRELRDQIRAPKINEAAIRAQSAKVGALQTELAVQRARVAHELRAVLTPAQIEQLHEMQVDVDARIDTALDRIAKRLAAE
jgi:Spy/CpxP family protein refolding chaperone